MGRNSFAVATPRSVDLQKYLLITFQNLWFEVISNNSFDCAGLIGGNRGWFQERVHLSNLNLGYKSCEIFSWKVWSISDIFFSGINKIDECRSSVNFNAEILSESSEVIFILLLVDSGEDMFWVASRSLHKLSWGSWVGWASKQNQGIFFVFEDSVDCLLTKGEILWLNFNEEDDEEED